MSNLQVFLTIAVAALVTMLIRFLPFFVFGGGKKTPEMITRLSKILPSAVMGMLVIYCLKDTTFTALSGWLPALIAVAVTVGLHVWKRQTLLSILGGTVVYMILVNLVFV